MTDPRPGAYEADLNAAADANLSIEFVASLGDSNLDPGQFADFMALDRPMRIFVLKSLAGDATDVDYAWFSEQPDSRAVARWMQTLPAFRAFDWEAAADAEMDEVWPGEAP